MQVVGYREVPVDNIEVSGKFGAHLKDPAIIRKAANVKLMGLIHEPVVRVLADGRKVCVAGERRLAACKLAGLTPTVKLVTCSDQEAQGWMLAENAEREHNPQRQREELLQLVDTFAGEFAQLEPTGRRTAKGEARRAAAELRGVKAESVRQAERREKLRQKALLGKSDVPTPEKPPIALMGMKPSPIVIANAARSVDAVEEMIQLTLKSRAALEKLLSEPDGVHQARVKAMKAKLEEVSAYLRGMKPTFVCPACKALPQLTPTCVTCEATGYILKDAEGQIPARLWDENAKVVRVQKGKSHEFVPVEQFLPEEEEEEINW